MEFLKSIIAQIIAGVVLLLLVALWNPSKEFILNNIIAQIIVGVIFLVFAVLIWKIIKKAYLRVTKQAPSYKPQKYEYIIPFDYAPESPDKHGWVITPIQGVPPSFSSIQDSFYGNILHITCAQKWQMDYLVASPQDKYKRVEFIINQNDRNRDLYVYVLMKSISGKGEQKIWFNLQNPGTEVRNHPKDDKEKLAPAIHNRKYGEWIGVEANIPDLIRLAYPNEFWEFDKIVILRIRGTVRIALIGLNS